jgi:transposase
MDPFKEWINWILEGDQKVPKKQRHTAHRIFMRLVEEKGFKGSEVTVRKYVRLWKQAHTKKEGFLRLSYEPGEDAQADFGQAQVIIANRQETVHYLVCRLCYSRKSYVVAFPRETRECLFEGLRRIFEALGGVPRRIWFDNLSAAVKKILKGHRREETEDFIGFRSHYLFEPVFCRPRKGNEKGHAENLVGFSRRNFMVPLPEVENFKELNNLLMERCQKDGQRKVNGESIEKRFEVERPKLLPLPHRRHPCRVYHYTRVNKFQELYYNTFVYSVPVEYVHRKVRMHIGAFSVEIACENKVIACHRRCYRPEDSGINPLHYLDTLEYKARAVEYASVLKQWNLPKVFRHLREELKRRYVGVEGDREYVRVLKLHREFDVDTVEIAVGLALEYGAVSSDGVKSLCHQLTTSTLMNNPINLTNRSRKVQKTRSWTPNLSNYNLLMKGGEA